MAVGVQCLLDGYLHTSPQQVEAVGGGTHLVTDYVSSSSTDDALPESQVEPRHDTGATDSSSDGRDPALPVGPATSKPPKNSMAQRIARACRSLLDPGTYLHSLRILHYYGYSHVQERRRLTVGQGSTIAPNVSLANAERITIGVGTKVGERAALWAGEASGSITIGDHCQTWTRSLYHCLRLRPPPRQADRLPAAKRAGRRHRKRRLARSPRLRGRWGDDRRRLRSVCRLGRHARHPAQLRCRGLSGPGRASPAGLCVSARRGDAQRGRRQPPFSAAQPASQFAIESGFRRGGLRSGSQPSRYVERREPGNRAYATADLVVSISTPAPRPFATSSIR